jgi:hypothetical protein
MKIELIVSLLQKLKNKYPELTNDEILKIALLKVLMEIKVKLTK